MSQQSQTGSQSPPPVVVVQEKPYGALSYQSSINNNNQISAILKKHGLKICSKIPIRTPNPDERSCCTPLGSKKLQYTAWSQEHMQARALLPLRPYFMDFLDYVRISPFQLQTNAYRVLATLKSMYHLQGWEGPSPQEICYLLALKRSPKENKGFYYLASWPQEKRLIEDMPNKARDFKADFF